MAEKDADDNPYELENTINSDSVETDVKEDTASGSAFDEPNKKKDNESFDLGTYLPSFESSLKKEENPFSFKKFLNQDSSAQKDKGAKKKTYTATGVTASKDLPNQNLNRTHINTNVRTSSATDVSSVLPDFVQDHLVVEQCYLSGGSGAVDIDNLNFQNMPDLNLDHRNVHFRLNTDRNTSHINSNSSDHMSTNLPDFTFGATSFQSDTQVTCNNKTLPDFALNATHNVTGSPDNQYDHVNFSRRTNNISNGIETSQSSSQRNQACSPSVPLDLPLYDSNELNQNASIPFDLTAPAEEKSSNRRRSSKETASKSLPDFLSDGPIEKELHENLHSIRGNAPLMHNGLPPPEISSMGFRSDHERLISEVEMLRRQLTEKNRRLEMLESELEHLHNTDQRETASLEYALQEVEKNLKQTAKRAMTAENMVCKLKQENKLLKSENSSLRSENIQLRLGNCDSPMPSSQDLKSQRVANELRIAANVAENSLRSLLTGVENLRVMADSIENVHRFEESSDDYRSFAQEDSASGPAL